MITAKEKVLDRIEQTFSVFIKNPIALITPLLVVNFIMISVAPLFLAHYFLSMSFINMNDIIQSLYILFIVAIIYGIVYMILVIPATLATMKAISDIILGRSVSIGESFNYGVSRIGKSFTVYWYMFAYAYLVPAICFIIAGLIMIYGLYTNTDTMRYLGSILMGLAAIYALIQGVYRGLKSSFALPGAVLNEDYTRVQFQKSIGVTTGKWWRIFGNFLLIGIIAGLSMSLITGLLSSIGFLGSDINDFIPIESTELESLENAFSSMGGFNMGGFIIDTISQIISTIVTVFIMTFSMILYMRLRDESGHQDTQTKQQVSYIEEL